MKTTIEININNIGKNEGTIGWLLEQPIKITIGTTKSGKTCAWLNIGEKSENVACYGHNLSDCQPWATPGKISDTEIDRINPHSYEAAFGIVFTDTAWSKVENLIDLARDQFQQAIGEMEADEIETAAKVEFSVSPKF